MLVTGIIVVAIALIALWVAVTYNRLVSRRLACDNSWSQIDVALKRRHDLVPNLAAAVAGYASHERGTFEAVTAARTAAVAADDAPPAQRGQAEAALAQRISGLTVLIEQYPDLRASASFRDLQGQLVEVENQIQITRRVYNDTVETYNTLVQTFPTLLIAAPLGFKVREFFIADMAARVVPVVGSGGPTSGEGNSR